MRIARMGLTNIHVLLEGDDLISVVANFRDEKMKCNVSWNDHAEYARYFLALELQHQQSNAREKKRKRS